jgi:hypothetical protein
MRLITNFAVLLCCLSSSCFGQSTDLAATTKTAPKTLQQTDRSKHDQSIRASLNQKIDIDFDEIPWSEVEEFLENTLQLNIVLTTSAQDDSLGEDEPITCQLKGMTVRSALRILLVNKNATFLVQDNVVKIISLDDAEDEKFFTNHFINVRHLLASISELEKNRIGQPRLIRPATGGGKMAGGPAMLQVQSAGKTTAESMLLDLIQASVNPDQWKDSGQGLATIKIMGGYVVAGCNESLADSIEDFLTDLNFHLSRD